MDDESELRDRIDKLEQIVAAQQQTIEEHEQQSLLGSWGRRGVLGGIAAALGIASASGSAAAGVGDIGTPSSRVDVFGDQGDFNALEAMSAVIGSGDTINQIEYGSVSIDPGTASDDSTDSESSNNTTTVTFDSEMPSIPNVSTWVNVSKSALLITQPRAKTTTSVEVVLRNFSTADPSATEVGWLAIA